MFSHLKRRIGVLTAVAVLAALVPTLSISSASAAASSTAVTRNDTATFVACPSGSAASAGFTDTTSTDVDCIAMYGITTGVTATTYEPTASVPRWQMALYLTRFLSEAGYTLGSGADQGFTDISGESAAIQTAINQIKQAGVTTGTTATTYSPADNVTREQIAMFIERSLALLTPGPGGNSDDVLTTKISGLAGNLLNYTYTDIDANVTFEGHNAIIELFHLGVTGDTGAVGDTYRPTDDLTRAEMATFLTNAAAHTNLRPEGLWLQTSTASGVGGYSPTGTVSYRDASFDPISGALVDVFSWTHSTVEGNAAFLSTGLCDDAVTAASLTACTIDVGEVSTGTTGNMTPTFAALADPGAGLTSTITYYAWTAASGTVYDNDVNGSGTAYTSVDMTTSAGADETRCSMDTPTRATVATVGGVVGSHTMKYGAVTTISCQVTDGAAATSAAVPLASRKVTMNQSREFDLDSVGTQDGNTILTTQTVGLTDATGLVTFTITGPADPSTGDDRHIDIITLTGIEAINAIGTPGTTTSGHMVDTGFVLTISLNYEDVTAVADKTIVTQTVTSGAISATTGITRTANGTAYDQYGDTAAGATMSFASSNALPGGFACDVAATVECTSSVPHGLSDGDQLTLTDAGALTDGVGAAPSTAYGAFCVGTVGTTTTFMLESTCGVAYDNSAGAGVPSTTASPAVFASASFAPVDRTTNSAGVASLSWSDKTSTSGKDTVSGVVGVTTPGSSSFYRLGTAASFAEAGDDDALLNANTDVLAKLVEWDSTNDDFIIEVSDATDATNFNTPTLTYFQYSYDANDQYFLDGAVAGTGTPTTMALWESAMTTKSGTSGGTYGDVSDITYQALSTGVASFSEGE